jgi:transcriptional regulator with XRE-family HTH domain
MEPVKRDVLKDYLKSVGQNIKKYRKKKGLSMEDLGMEIGLDRMNINRIEKGLNMTLSTILKLSLALDIKPHVLLKSKVQFEYTDLDKLVSQNKASKITNNKKTFQTVKPKKTSPKSAIRGGNLKRKS